VRALAAADKKCRRAGLTAARCDLAFRMGQIDAARATCARALAADPDDSWALYLDGCCSRPGSTPAGIDKLKKGSRVDPELGQGCARWAGDARKPRQARARSARRAYAAKFVSRCRCNGAGPHRILTA